MVDWEKKEEEFDKIEEITKKLYFLRNLITETNICNNTQCEIFPKLHEFKTRLKNLREYVCKNIKEAESKLENVIDLKNFIELHDILEQEAESIFSLIFAMFSSKKAKDSKHKQQFDEYMETLDKINENGFPMTYQVQNKTQQKLDEISGSVQFLDEDYKKPRENFQKFMKEQKKKSKKGKKEKSED